MLLLFSAFFCCIFTFFALFFISLLHTFPLLGTHFPVCARIFLFSIAISAIDWRGVHFVEAESKMSERDAFMEMVLYGGT